MKHAVPEYVSQGGCADCLKVWSKERDKLLKQIEVLKRENMKLKARQAPAGKVS